VNFFVFHVCSLFLFTGCTARRGGAIAVVGVWGLMGSISDTNFVACAALEAGVSELYLFCFLCFCLF
jgi:hypothetical protein